MNLESLNRCVYCGSRDMHTALITKDYSDDTLPSYSFSQCNDCALLFQNPRVPESAIGSFYKKNYQPYSAQYNKITELFIARRTKREVREFKRLNPKLKRVLEIGCSWGKYLMALRDYGGLETVGVEIHEESSRAGKKLQLDIRSGDLLSQKFPSNSFDLVVMNHVIEHLYNPVETLREVKRALSSGGVLFIRTPNIKSLDRAIFGNYWLDYDPPRHIALFSPPLTQQLLSSIGFKDVKIKYESLPNEFILSIRNMLRDKNLPSGLVNFFNLNNYLLLIFFALPALMFGLLGSGRMIVYCKKP